MPNENLPHIPQAIEPAYEAMLGDNSSDHPTAEYEGDGIMSNGTTVEAWNYASSVEALKAVTGSDEWTV